MIQVSVVVSLLIHVMLIKRYEFPFFADSKHKIMNSNSSTSKDTVSSSSSFAKRHCLITVQSRTSKRHRLITLQSGRHYLLHTEQTHLVSQADSMLQQRLQRQQQGDAVGEAQSQETAVDTWAKIVVYNKMGNSF